MPPRKSETATKKTGSSGGDIGARIVKLKDDDGRTWQEISEITGLSGGKAMMAYLEATTTSATRIAAKNEDELKKKLAKGRQDGLSWGVLAARSGKTEGFCKKAFEEITGESARGHRIGKGGRHPAEEGYVPEAKKASKVAKAAKKGAKPTASGAVKKAAKKAPAKKATKAVKKTAKAAA